MRTCFLPLAAATPVILLLACGRSGTTAVARAPLPAPSRHDVTPAELQAMMRVKNFVLVNVHVPYAGDIPRTDLSIPFDQIAAQRDRLPAHKTAEVVLYCRSGAMSEAAAATLLDLGYTNVFHLVGGMRAWSAAGYPLDVR